MPKVKADIVFPDLLRRVSRRSGVTQRVARRVIDAMIEELTGSLQLGHSVHVNRLGVFATRIAQSRTTSNPNDRSQRIVVPPRLSIVYRRSPSLAKKVRRGPLGASLRERRTS